VVMANDMLFGVMAKVVRTDRRRLSLVAIWVSLLGE
jgi:hypothetical protein